MIYILLIYLIAGAVLFFFQRKLLYFPTGKIPHAYETLTLENENETLEVVVLLSSLLLQEMTVRLIMVMRIICKIFFILSSLAKV